MRVLVLGLGLLGMVKALKNNKIKRHDELCSIIQSAFYKNKFGVVENPGAFGS